MCGCHFGALDSAFCRDVCKWTSKESEAGLGGPGQGGAGRGTNDFLDQLGPHAPCAPTPCPRFTSFPFPRGPDFHGHRETMTWPCWAFSAQVPPGQTHGLWPFWGFLEGWQCWGWAAVSPGKQDEEEIMNQFLTLYSRWAFLWHRIGNSVATLEDKHLFSRD